MQPALRAFLDALESLGRETDATCDVMRSGLVSRDPEEDEEV